jgi:hypothetical protein
MWMPVGGAIRGVAAGNGLLFAAVDGTPASTLRAYRGNAEAWHAEIAGHAGMIAATENLVVASSAVSTGAKLGATTVRAEPAAALSAFDAASGKATWTTVFDSTDWVLATSLAALGPDVNVGGTFGGTLRVGSHVVTSAGGSDGFVARVRPSGELAWLIRLGGWGADGVQGVATRGDRIAVAGSFTAGAELGGVTLPPYDDRSAFSDVFVAELDGNGARRWAATLGGRGDDAAAGVALDDRGNAVVAASAKEVVHVGSQQLVTQGEGDGVVAWFGDGGEKGSAVLVGGLDFDGLRAITAVGDKVVVGGFFSGTLKLADRSLTAGGGDDAFLAALDANGTIASVWHVSGEGREEITALAPIAGGFVAGIAHTAKASVEGAQLAAPADPMQGGALIVRGVP